MMLRDAFRLAPVSTLRVDEWADKYRRLPAISSAIPGPWKTERVEATRGILRAFHEPGVKTISVCAGTQTVKTESLLCILGFVAHQSPAPVIFCGPKEQYVEAFSRERLSKMIAETPVLRERFNPRQKVGEDTLTWKEFPGGSVALVAAGSDINLASRAARITLCDEIDAYPVLKGGDPVKLVEERTSTFADRAMHVRVCSPTSADTSRIWQSYLEGDQRKPFLCCPHCKAWTHINFFHGETGSWVNWDEPRVWSSAAIFCEFCGAQWSEDDRRKSVTTKFGIRWQQTAKFRCSCSPDVERDPLKLKKWDWDDLNQVGYALCECGKRGVSNHHASFQASKLVAPWVTVPELARRWIEALDSPDTKHTFRNTQLGEPSDLDRAAASVSVQVLLDRREKWEQVPAGVFRLTFGTDVQHSRLETHVLGWGKNEIWSVDYMIHEGDPNRPEVWEALDEYLLSPWPSAAGGAFQHISAGCIDAADGVTRQAVYNFCQPRERDRRIFAIQGAPDTSSATWTEAWPSYKPKTGRDNRYRAKIIGVSLLKQSVANHLAIAEPGAPGYFHFDSTWTETRFAQLTSEHKKLSTNTGFRHHTWVLPAGRANEALDTTVYAFAAHHALTAMGLTLKKAEAYYLRHRRGTPSVSGSQVRSSQFVKDGSNDDSDD